MNTKGKTMDPEQRRKFIRKHFPKDEEICPVAWAEGEMDYMSITIGQFTEYKDRMDTIQSLSISPYTACRHVKLMREAIEIITAHEKKEPEKI
jgi:hypothetical protein